MADPITIGLTLAGAATSALGAVFQGNAASNAASYNASIADMNADRSRTEAAARVEASVRKSRRVLGAQRAGIAQSGIAFEGSMSDVVQKSEANADLDALSLAYEGEAGARNYSNQAQLLRTQADNAKKAGYIGAATSVLSGLGRGYGQFRRGGSQPLEV